MHRAKWSGIAATVMLASTAFAGDTSFTPDAAAAWSARSLRMAGVVKVEPGQTITSNSFKLACDGLTGEQMHHEYGKAPRWAISSQLWICGAYDKWAKKFGGNKAPCGSLKKGLGELDAIDRGSYPPDVTEAANALRAASRLILQSAKDNHAC